MADKNMQKLPNGKWEYLVDEKNELNVVADTAEEAERMAKAYFKGNKSLAKKAHFPSGVRESAYHRGKSVSKHRLTPTGGKIVRVRRLGEIPHNPFPSSNIERYSSIIASMKIFGLAIYFPDFRCYNAIRHCRRK